MSKNGRLLLNVGPKADGTIPDEDRKILLEIGQWLKTYGEAIYGSKMWRKSAEGPTEIQEGQFTDSKDRNFTSEDFRFTINNGYIYAICLNMKGKNSVCIKSLSETADSTKLDFCGIIKSVEVLGNDDKPDWKRDKQGLKIRTCYIKSDKPVVFRIQVD